MDVDEAKQAVRHQVWAELDRAGAVQPPGAEGTIPKFVGADEAADRLASLAPWTKAAVVKANPDRAQLPVRERALIAGKLLYMAVPAMRTLRPFYEVDPAIAGPAAAASDHAGAVAPTVGLDEMRPVDLVVCGSVAVDRRGARVGKGAGYSDIEVALLTEAGLIGEHTVIVTTVHPLQVVENELPESSHDFRVDFIVTPDEVIQCGPSRRSPGIEWQHLSSQKIEAIPVLAAPRPRREDRL